MHFISFRLFLCSVEILDESGVTPAHFAAQGGHLECLEVGRGEGRGGEGRGGEGREGREGRGGEI